MSREQPGAGNVDGAESSKNVDDAIKSSVAVSTTGAVAVVRPRASSAPRREMPSATDRRVSSDVVVTSTKHVAKPWKQDRAVAERRGHSQTGEPGSEPRLTHERLQQYAAAHARITAAARPGPRSMAGSTLLRKITNLSALVPSSPTLPQQPGAGSPTSAAATAAIVRNVSSAPVISPATLVGVRLAPTTPGIPPPGMAAPTGARPASAQRPQSPRQLLQRIISFSQPMPQLQQQPQRQPGAPPPERAFGPRAADYPSRHNALVRPMFLSHSFGSYGSGGGGGGGADYSWQPPQPNQPAHPPHYPTSARRGDPRVSSARYGRLEGGWTRTEPARPDTAQSAPVGYGLVQGQVGQGQVGQGAVRNSWESLHSTHRDYPDVAAAAAATAAAAAAAAETPPSPAPSPAPAAQESFSFPSPPMSPRPRSAPLPPPPRQPQQQPQQPPPWHHHQQHLPMAPTIPAPPTSPAPPTPVAPPQQQPQQQQPQAAEPLPQLLPTSPPLTQQQQQQQQPAFPSFEFPDAGDQFTDAGSSRPPSPQPLDRRLRPRTPRGSRPQSSGTGTGPGPGPARWGPYNQQQQQQVAQAPGQVKPSDMVVVGLRDVPPSQLPFARAVMGSRPSSPGLLHRSGGGGGARSSDDGTHASWWQGPGGGGGGGDSEASYPLTAVTDRNAGGDDEMTASEAAVWLARMAELEAEVLEEREFRRKYEEELRRLAAAAAAAGRPPGSGPMLWQTTGGRVVTGARAAAAAVMRHRAGLWP